jgi:hypothetical protein
MKSNSMLKVALLSAAITIPGLQAQSFGPTGTTTISVTVGAEASIAVTTSTTTLTGAAFADYTGTTNLLYKIRTSASGSGAITAQVTTDFSPANGPSVATPPTAGDALTYTCTVAAPGTACSGTQTASTTAATPVASFGADNRSANSGNAAALAWTLTNDSTYKAGTYSATVTFTISAT